MWVLKGTQLTDKLKNQSESNKQAQDNLHEQVQEQKTLLRSAQDRAHTLETSVTELTTQLADSKEKVAQLDAQVRPFTSTSLQYNGWVDIVVQFAFIDFKIRLEGLIKKTHYVVLQMVTVSMGLFSSAEGKDRDAAICRGSQSCTES